LRARTHNLLQCFRVIRMLIQQAKTIEKLLCIRRMKGTRIVEDEVLGDLPGVVRQHLALYADDLNGQPPGCRDVIGEDVPRIRRETHHSTIGFFLGKQSLAQLFIEAWQYRKFCLQQTVTLGMNTTNGVALPFLSLVYPTIARPA